MKAKNIFMTVAAFAALIFLAAPESLKAQEAKIAPDRLAKELERAMSRETPLTEDDYRIYMANLDKIFALRQAPERAGQTAAEISDWTPSRFAYVTTKMAVGMSMLLKPDDPKNQAVPAFARPTEREMNLIENHRDELVKSVEALEARAR